MGVHIEKLRSIEETRRQLSRADRHDVRTPLNSLLLNVQAVREFGDVNEDQQACLEAAERNARELLKMVDHWLDPGSVDPQGRLTLQVREVRVPALFAEAATQVQPLARQKGVRLEALPPETDFALALDSEKFVRVLVNLLANGIKFTPPGGTVTATAQLEGGRTRFRVEDTGIGIAPEHLARIFEEGFRVDAGAPIQTSAGVGLAYCRRVVEEMGGTLSVESEPGRGSTFIADLPHTR
jgi:signal transduction histidine kinase